MVIISKWVVALSDELLWFLWIWFELTEWVIGQASLPTKLNYAFLFKNKNSYIWTHNSHKHYARRSTVSGRHSKAVSNLQSCLTDSYWIRLILLIKLIQYKIGKTRFTYCLIESTIAKLLYLYFWSLSNPLFISQEQANIVTQLEQGASKEKPFYEHLKRCVYWCRTG